MKRKILIITIILSMIFTMLPSVTGNAAAKQYGIVIANENGNFTFYDLNDTNGQSGIEISSSGNVMIPLAKIVSKMPALKYSYNSKTKEATVKNTINGKKVVFKLNSIYCYYYSTPKSSAVKKSMTYKMYKSTETSALMIHMSALNWVMAAGGYQYYKVADMQKAGYDTSEYSGLMVYNPYGKVSGIPKSTIVTGISKTVKVTIPEGYSLTQIFDLLVSKGVCASTEFLYNALDQYDFSKYPLIAAIPENENRCFLLEGYLYPDTYEFYRLSSGVNVLDKLLKNIEAKITDDDRAKAESLGYTMDQILTIASLVEKEVGNADLMPYVSSVIHNRLKIGMKLRLDATYFYLNSYLKPYIGNDLQRYYPYYDTYTCAGLPAGPICNPGRKAIQAALNPAQTDYLFFYSDDQGEYHFSVEYVNPKKTTTDPAASDSNTSDSDVSKTTASETDAASN